MTSAAHDKQALIDWAIAERPLPGQTVSGDLFVVQPFDHGLLLAVVDGVGHGDEAIAAARAAVEILEARAEESVITLVNRCHRALAQTRGAVMTLASLNPREDTVTWLGVGNVEGRLLRANCGATHPVESVLLR